jgi:hypothetical protein
MAAVAPVPTASTGKDHGVALFDLFLDVPHPAASAACRPPLIVRPPQAAQQQQPISEELVKNIGQIVRFAFPEYDENDPRQRPAQASSPSNAPVSARSITDSSKLIPLNRYDMYAMNNGTTFTHFTFTLQLSSGVRCHGHVRKYLPAHVIASSRYDVGRRGSRAIVILTRGTGANQLYTAILKYVTQAWCALSLLPSLSPCFFSEPSMQLRPSMLL